MLEFTTEILHFPKPPKPKTLLGEGLRLQAVRYIEVHVCWLIGNRTKLQTTIIIHGYRCENTQNWEYDKNGTNDDVIK